MGIVRPRTTHLYAFMGEARTGGLSAIMRILSEGAVLFQLPAYPVLLKNQFVITQQSRFLVVMTPTQRRTLATRRTSAVGRTSATRRTSATVAR